MEKTQALKLSLLLSLILIAPSSLIWSSNKYGSSNQLGLVVSASAEATHRAAPRSMVGHQMDAISHLSLVINQLVDSLIDRFSFLAEIVIESARDELCEISCKAKLDQTAGKELREKQFERKEFSDVRYLLESFTATNEKKKSTGSGPAGRDEQNESECSLFNINIDKRDLPVSEMRHCCKAKRSCYESCGEDKRECDSKFESCLNSMCKDKYDGGNNTAPVPLVRKLTGKPQKRSAGAANETGRGASRRGANLPPVRETEDDDDDDEPKGASPEVNEDEDEEDNDDKPKDDNQNEADKEENDKDFSERYGTKRTKKNRMRDKYRACKLASKVLIIGNLAFGCQAYRQAQWSACCGRNISIVGPSGV